MYWEMPNLVESLKIFKQQCELFFSVKGIASSTCSACGRKNHWARMCHNKKLKKNKKTKNKNTDRQPQTNRSTKPKKFAPVQYAHTPPPPELYLCSGPGSERVRENVFLFNGRLRKKVLLDRGICLIGHYFTKQERYL